MRKLDMFFSKCMRVICIVGLAACALELASVLLLESIGNELVLEFLVNSVPWVVLGTLLGIIISFAVLIAVYSITMNSYMEKEIERARHVLTPEFIPVFLKDQIIVCKDKARCEARIDENGKIICKVTADLQFDMDEFNRFLKFFSLDEEEEE